MPEESADDKPKQFLGLSGIQTIGSALAAVTSAFVGSFLGVAGTLIGAALGSIVATVGAAIYAKTLHTAATVTLRRIPQRGRRGLPAEDGDVLVAVVPAEIAEPRAERVRRQFTPKTWIKVGAASAATFVIAMVGVTAVEFGTNQPMSSLVSSTSSIDGGATGPTTLGTALSGDSAVPNEGNESTGNVEEGPGKAEEAPREVEEGAKEESGLTRDGSTGSGDSGLTGTEEPAADESLATLPSDPAPETEQSPEPAPASEQTSEPEVSSDSESAKQPTP